MNMTIRWDRFASCTLFLSLTWMLHLQSIDSRWGLDKTGDSVGTNARAEDFLDLRGDVPNPRRLDAAEMSDVMGLTMVIDYNTNQKSPLCLPSKARFIASSEPRLALLRGRLVHGST